MDPLRARLVVGIALLAALPGQAPPVVLVSGIEATLPPSALQLGDGGVVSRQATLLARPGEAMTPGGVRIVVRPQGAKLDFPSGAELLITPSLRICLRDGSQTLPPLGRLRLALADGTLLELEPDGVGKRPLRAVRLVHGSTRATIWPPSRTAVDANYQRSAGAASDLLVLGDGRAIYRPVPLGPILVLRAVLRPRDDERWPAARVVVFGDPLAASLQRLPGHLPPQPVQFPQAPEAARRLSALAPSLFAGRVERKASAVGPLVLPLVEGWHLGIDLAAGSDRLTLGLLRADATVPAVEWVVGDAGTELYLVRPDGGGENGPRYFMKGLPLPELGAMLPWIPTLDDLRWARAELVRLGAR